ncbi:MAG: Hpt domain-containing protein [Gammaproteobacteria bacterium]
MAQTSIQHRRATAPAAVIASVAGAVPNDGFDDLREAFQARLKGDRAHFVVLSTALARTENIPTQIFDDLQYRAHRLRGSASIFEVAEIASAANALEQAAASASVSHADNTDPAVWSALVALVRIMGHGKPKRARRQATGRIL